MFQYITAVSSGIIGMWGIMKGYLCRRKKQGTSSEMGFQKGYASVVFLGLASTASLLLLLLAAEAWYKPIPVGAAGCVGFIAAGSALLLIGLLLKYEYLNNHSQRLHSDNKLMLREKKILEQKVADLITHSDIAQAAASSKTFGCFMGSIARLLRKDREARELTIFSCYDDKILPHTYYQFSDFSELCLSFAKRELDKYFADNPVNIAYDSSMFGARNLVLEYVDGNITIEGGLLYNSHAVGRVRITLFECSEISQTFQDLTEGIVNNALSSVRISYDGVYKAMRYEHPVLTEVANAFGVMMLRLEVEESILGVVKLAFRENSSQSIKRQKTILRDASSHISKAMYNQRLYELAVKDGLTQLYNKRYLLEMLQHHCAEYMVGVEKLAFMLIDIDFFKKVNDTWGHLIGDKVLKRISYIVADTARDTDVVARYGGEELAVLMPQTDLDGARILAERIRQNIEQELFANDKGESFSVTASFGVAELLSSMLTTNDIIAAADKALYIAKNSGRNRVVISNDNMDDSIAA